MINKLLTTSSSLLLLTAMSLSSCNNSENKSVEEVHNPASQTIPEESKDLIGRWDLTIDKDGKSVPSWLEIKLSGFTTLVGAFVGDSGSQRPVSRIKLDKGIFSFSIPTQWEDGGGEIKVEGSLSGSEIKGTITSNKGVEHSFTGVRAPYLVREGEAVWGEAIELFNGKDLTGWTNSTEDGNWKVVDGILVNEKAGGNLISDQKFEDFKLIAEYKYPEGSNGGIYLRGRYELQIEDSPLDKHPGSLYFGGIYGFLAPNQMATLGPNVWQKYEVTLRGRLITVVSNGKTIINEQEIPGITGGALDSNEGEPGPIYLQGDHGPIEFRKLTIIPAK